jgi:hypothetical protein
MERLLAWLHQHWFNAVQTVGIVGSLLLTLAALRRDARARRTTDYLTLSALHRELWSELHRRPELARITQPVADLVSAPLSVPEEEFLMLVINHFHVGWRLFREGGLLPLQVLAADARAFFTLPLPHLVWERSKQPRNPRFVQFIEDALASYA